MGSVVVNRVNHPTIAPMNMVRPSVASPEPFAQSLDVELGDGEGTSAFPMIFAYKIILSTQALDPSSELRSRREFKR